MGSATLTVTMVITLLDPFAGRAVGLVILTRAQVVRCVGQLASRVYLFNLILCYSPTGAS